MQSNDWDDQQLKKKSAFYRAAEILKGRIVTNLLTGEVMQNTWLVWHFIDAPEKLRDIAEGNNPSYIVRDKPDFKNGVYQNYEQKIV